MKAKILFTWPAMGITVLFLVFAGCGSRNSTPATPKVTAQSVATASEKATPTDEAQKAPDPNTTPADIGVEREPEAVGASVDSMFGDCDGNGIVDASDLFPIASKYGVHRGEAGYSVQADADGNGIIDASDLFPIAAHYGNEACVGACVAAAPVKAPAGSTIALPINVKLASGVVPSSISFKLTGYNASGASFVSAQTSIPSAVAHCSEAMSGDLRCGFVSLNNLTSSSAGAVMEVLFIVGAGDVEFNIEVLETIDADYVALDVPEPGFWPHNALVQVTSGSPRVLASN